MQNSHQLRKRAYVLVFKVGGGWWWRRTTTNIKNEHTRSFSRLVVGGSGGEQPPTAKTSVFARFRGWWLVEVQGSGGGHWRVVVGKKPLRLAFEQGRGSGGVKQVVVVSIEGGGVNGGWWPL